MRLLDAKEATERPPRAGCAAAGARVRACTAGMAPKTNDMTTMPSASRKNGTRQFVSWISRPTSDRPTMPVSAHEYSIIPKATCADGVGEMPADIGL